MEEVKLRNRATMIGGGTSLASGLVTVLSKGADLMIEHNDVGLPVNPRNPLELLITVLGEGLLSAYVGLSSIEVCASTRLLDIGYMVAGYGMFTGLVLFLSGISYYAWDRHINKGLDVY